MLRLLLAAAILTGVALMLDPAYAQMGGGGRHHEGGGAAGSDQKKRQVDDKAYKAALDRIPEPKDKYDPWGTARPAVGDAKKAR